MPGCLEYTGVMTQLLREAKENRGDLVVLWLDLTNAFGSKPHKLVEEALRRHHVPTVKCNLINNYYRGCPRGVMVKAMDCGIVVREFVL